MHQSVLYHSMPSSEAYMQSNLQPMNQKHDENSLIDSLTAKLWDN